MTDYTPVEQLVVCMSREIHSGESLGMGLGTALPASAVMLAARTHARHLYLYLPGAGAFCPSVSAASLTLQEFLAEPVALRFSEMSEVLTELGGHLKSFFRPAQIDAYGNFNATVIGSYENPRIRLPGAAGLPDVMAIVDAMYFYIPRHTPQIFVGRLDFLSGLGHLPGRDPEQRRRLGLLGAGPALVITNLGVFDFSREGRMQVRSLHRDVSLEDVRAATGFPLDSPETTPVTEPPTEEELRLLREEIDPLGMRDLEMLASRERVQLIRGLYMREPSLLREGV